MTVLNYYKISRNISSYGSVPINKLFRDPPYFSLMTVSEFNASKPNKAVLPWNYEWVSLFFSCGCKKQNNTGENLFKINILRFLIKRQLKFKK